MKIRILLALAFLGLISPANAQNYNATAGSGLVFGSKFVTSVNYPQIVFCDPATPSQCVGVNSSGQMTVLLGASSAIVGKVGIDQTTVGTTNGVSLAQIGANTVLTGNGVSGTGSQRVNIASDNTAFSVNATLQASAATAIGKVDPNTIATWGLVVATQNSTTPTNGHLIEGQFNTTPTTITSGNVSPLQLDNAGNLLVNIKAGASSGAVAQGSTTSGQTGGLVQCASTTAAPTYTTATTNPINCDTSGNIRVNVTNTNTNGSATSANSSPVVIASDQAAVATKAASAAYVAGSIADLAHGSATSANSVPVVLATDQAAADPCMFKAKTNLAISQNGTSSVQLVALSGSTSIYVCSISLIAAGATTVALTTGTGTACVTSNAAVIGTTTASIANSISLASNGGFTLGNGGGTIAKGAASSELCMVLGTSVFVSGNLTYVQQ